MTNKYFSPDEMDEFDERLQREEYASFLSFWRGCFVWTLFTVAAIIGIYLILR